MFICDIMYLLDLNSKRVFLEDAWNENTVFILAAVSDSFKRSLPHNQDNPNKLCEFFFSRFFLEK